MKILKLLNKKYLSIFIIFVLSFSFNLKAEEEPIDIWNLEKEAEEKSSVVINENDVTSEIKIDSSNSDANSTINKIEIPSTPNWNFINPSIQIFSSINWNSEDEVSNKYQRKSDRKKLNIDEKIATYLEFFSIFFSLPLVIKINKAPIVGSKIKDDIIGKLIISYENNILSEHDLLASNNVRKKNIISRILSSINYLIWGDV